MLSALFAVCFIAIILTPSRASACVTIIAGKDRTRSGSIIHAHLEDMGVDAVGKVWRTEAASHAPGATVAVPYESVPVPEKTFGYWATGNADDAEGLGINTLRMPYNNILAGFNDNAVIMSCNWCYSREENSPESGLRRYALRQLVLEQAEGARHGVELLGSWMDRYGQADWGGLQFQLSDANEAWIVEVTSRRWVARKLADDEIFVMANRFTIGEQYDMGSHDLVAFAVANGWHDRTAPFHFADAYTLPQRRNSPYDTERERRMLSMLSAGGKIEIRDILAVFQDRYEGTELFVIPDDSIQIWEEEAEKNNRPRPICTNLAQSFFAATHGGGTAENRFAFFLGLGTPGYSGIFPLYPESAQICPSYFVEDGETPLAWRVFREIQRRTDKDFQRLSNKVKQYWEQHNLAVLERVFTMEAADKNALTLEESRENLVRARAILEDL